MLLQLRGAAMLGGSHYTSRGAAAVQVALFWTGTVVHVLVSCHRRLSPEQWLFVFLPAFDLSAVIDVPFETFMPNTPTKTSILILRKKMFNERSIT